MKSFYRSSLLVAAVALVAATSPLSAQMASRQKEIRLDFISFQTSDGDNLITADFPGSLALGIYMNKNIAIEPRISVLSFSGNGNSGTILGVGLAVPYYFAGDFGKSGFFVAPAVQLENLSGDAGDASNVDYGVDLGLKKTHRDRVSMRFAATYRDGDSSTEAIIGASFGVGLFWR